MRNLVSSVSEEAPASISIVENVGSSSSETLVTVYLTTFCYKSN
jgi:hypothetical protein